MDEAKRKMIEAKLCELFAQAERVGLQNAPLKSTSGATRVIRRRKGNPDVHIADEQAAWDSGAGNVRGQG
ncbi:MAG: hypothetical protein WAM61_06730 [Desulfobacterales bacterium]